MNKLELIATATFGLESVVAREVSALGYETKVENARVNFLGDKKAICRSNLWLRSADRVLVKVGEFDAVTFDELFEKTKALPWTDWLPENANFPVDGKSINSTLFSVSDCQAIVKKAIVESMKKKYKKSWFEESGPLYQIEISLLRDRATLTIDTSGAGLHKRGYRKLSTSAPLKETLAAAMINLSYWNPERILLDPFCGSGTIPIEAALIGLNAAPGLHRDFTAESWPLIPQHLWSEARQEAKDLLSRDKKLSIRGTDIDPKVMSIARYHAKLAEVNDFVSFQQMPVKDLSTKRKYGCLICNPPYGERLDDLFEVEELYRQMGSAFRSLDTWSIYVLTSNQSFERLFGRKADRRRKLYNGRIECQYYQFYGPRPPKKNP